MQSVTAALTALYAELAEEIPDVLTETFTFAAIWNDLARIAACLDAPLDLVPVAVPEFGQPNSALVYAD